MLEHRGDPLAAQALWRIATQQCGPQHQLKATLKTLQKLRQEYPGDPHGERAAYAEGLLYLWSGNKAQAKAAAARYTSAYPSGKYTQAVAKLLEEAQ